MSAAPMNHAGSTTAVGGAGAAVTGATAPSAKAEQIVGSAMATATAKATATATATATAAAAVMAGDGGVVVDSGATLTPPTAAAEAAAAAAAMAAAGAAATKTSTSPASGKDPMTLGRARDGSLSPLGRSLIPSAGRAAYFSQPLLPSPPGTWYQGLDDLPATAPAAAAAFPDTLNANTSPPAHASFAERQAGGESVLVPGDSQPLAGLKFGEGAGAGAGAETRAAAGSGEGEAKQAKVFSAEVQVGATRCGCVRPPVRPHVRSYVPTYVA